MAFKPGDKVVFLNENVNGTVTGVAGKGKYFVLLPEGIDIPVHENDLVLAEDQETSSKKSSQASASSQPTFSSAEQKEHEIFLAIAPDGMKGEAELLLVNHLPCKLFFTLNREEDGAEVTLTEGEAAANAGAIMISRQRLSEFDSWKNLAFNAVLVLEKKADLPPAMHSAIKLSPKLFSKPAEFDQKVGKEAYLVKLFPQPKNDAVEKPETAPEKKFTKLPKFEVEKPPQVVDLHLEKIIPGAAAVQPSEALNYQLQYFSACLEKAIALDYPQITFIHGVGNGILKQQIMNVLRKEKSVRKIKAAEEAQFGQGALVVHFG